MLALELAELFEAGFELALTGFENIEIDALLADAPSTEGETGGAGWCRRR